MNNDNPWRKRSSKVVYENPWIRVHEDKVVKPDGSDGVYGYIESKDSVIVVAADKQNQVYFIRAFSYPTAAWSWELPGGGGDDEDAEVAAKRELAEETGITANTWAQLGKVRVCDGLMTERMTVFLAQDLLHGTNERSHDDTHVISDGKFLSFSDIDQMIQSGEIDDGQSLAALYLARRHLSL